MRDSVGRCGLLARLTRAGVRKKQTRQKHLTWRPEYVYPTPTPNSVNRSISISQQCTLSFGGMLAVKMTQSDGAVGNHLSAAASRRQI